MEIKPTDADYIGELKHDIVERLGDSTGWILGRASLHEIVGDIDKLILGEDKEKGTPETDAPMIGT